MSSSSEHDRTARILRSAWLADARQELSIPVEGLLQHARKLQAQVPAEGPAAFLTAVGNILKRSQQLFELIDRHLEMIPDEDADATETAEYERKIRHDLRGHAAYIIGISQLWTKQAPRQNLAPCVPQLQCVLETANGIVTRLDKLVSFARCAPQPIPTEGLALLLERIDSLPSSQERGRLLVVDDNEDNRKLLAAILSDRGHHVTLAADGKEALDQVASQPFDLILLDVLMPVLSGFEVLDRLKATEAWRHIPVIVVSALDTMDSVIQCIARGAEDYLTRPVHPELLQARIGASLEKKRLRDREQVHLQRIDELLHAIFPHELVEELTEHATIRSRRYERVGICFLDIVGFTSYCDARRDRPEEVVARLQETVLAFEQIARRHGVQKIKTIGDAFMCTAGLLRPCEQPVLTLLRCALEMIEAARETSAGWQVRAGIHVGPVVAGVLGQTQYSFDLWGDSVNTASRMESHGLPGWVTFSPEAWREVAHRCEGVEREVHVEGKGVLRVIDFVAFRSA